MTSFKAKIVLDGDSLAIRIPSYVYKGVNSFMKLELGEIVEITIKKEESLG